MCMKHGSWPENFQEYSYINDKYIHFHASRFTIVEFSA